MRSRLHGGSQTRTTSALFTSGMRFDFLLHFAGQRSGHGAGRRGQRHLDLHRVVIVDLDVIDQAQLVNIDWNFGVVDLSQRLDDLGFQQFFLQGPAWLGGGAWTREWLFRRIAVQQRSRRALSEWEDCRSSSSLRGPPEQNRRTTLRRSSSTFPECGSTGRLTFEAPAF